MHHSVQNSQSTTWPLWALLNDWLVGNVLVAWTEAGNWKLCIWRKLRHLFFSLNLVLWDYFWLSLNRKSHTVSGLVTARDACWFTPCLNQHLPQLQPGNCWTLNYTKTFFKEDQLLLNPTPVSCLIFMSSLKSMVEILLVIQADAAAARHFVWEWKWRLK